jgi:hypothetical protein
MGLRGVLPLTSPSYAKPRRARPRALPNYFTPLRSIERNLRLVRFVLSRSTKRTNEHFVTACINSTHQLRRYPVAHCATCP